MPSRGTMGMRMSRLLVDGLLNNTTYCRGFPSDASRYLDGTVVPVGELVYTIKRQAPPAPVIMLYPSYVRVKFKTKLDFGGGNSIYSRVYVNGVYYTGTESSHNSANWTPVAWDIYGIKNGDLVQVWCKLDGATAGSIKDFEIACSYEGVVEVIGSGAW